MLTPKREEFARKIVEGMTQADAYRSAYDCKRTSDKSIWEKASRLMADPEVRTRVQELRDKIALESVMTAQERLEYLTRVIKGEEKEKTVQIVDGEPVEVEMPSALRTKLTAVDLMNKMQGEYVQKVQAEIENAVNINIELSDD